MNSKKNLSRKGGYVADYAKVSTPTDYMAYIPPANNSSSEGAVLVSNNNATPGMTNNAIVKGGSSLINLPNTFLYSMEGGCALCNSGGGTRINKNLKGGFGLEPFMTALALLGARMLADKEVGLFNNKSQTKSAKSRYVDED